METQNKSNTKGIIIGIIVIVIIAIITIVAGKKSPEASVETPIETPVTATTTLPVATTTPVVILYKDGSYSATGTYMSPGGLDKIAVTLVLKRGVVTDPTVTTVVADYVSKNFIGMFIGGFKEFVVGKKISDINVKKVSGSSLTGVGFNDALTQIKAQAKA